MKKCSCNGNPVRGAMCGYIIVSSKDCAAPDSYECYYKTVGQINNSLESINNTLNSAKDNDPEFYDELTEILATTERLRR